MKNLIYSLGKQSMLPILAVLLFFSCKKDDSSVDEIRYRKYWTKRTTTTPVVTDTTKTSSGSGTGTTGTGTTTGGTGTGTTTGGTGTGTGTTTGGTTGTGTTTTQGTNADPTTTPTMYNDFETSVTTGFNAYIQQAQTGLVALSTEQHVSGTHSAKFTVIQALALSTGESHSQITKIDKEAIGEGVEKWYSNDYYLPTPYPTDIQYIRQWHHDASNYSPPVALCTEDGKLKWDYFTAYGDNGKDVFVDLGAYPTNQWFHVTIHMIFSSTSGKALSEVWVDGVKKMSITTPNKYPGLNNIAMFGLYKWIYKIAGYSPSVSTTMYADNYKEW